MAAKDSRLISAAGDEPPKWMVLLALLLLLLASPASAQQSPERSDEDDPYKTSVSPALAILIVAIVSSFFLLGFFSVYLRRCAGDNSAVTPAILAVIGGGRSRRGARRGLDPALLEKFPTMVYSAVKGHKLGKETLECAVCLCEFEDDDILRLLPKCNHVFHRDCIDVWLATHVTCPVCRSNLDVDDAPSETDRVIIAVDYEAEEINGSTNREAELADLVRIGSQRREAAARSRSGSVRRMLPRSVPSTGDWEAVVFISGDGNERFRLRLPEDVRREILAAGRLRRSASFAVFPERGEGSSRRGYREGASRPWRSLRLGRSGRWPFLGRSFSVRGRGEVVPEGSSKGRAAAPFKWTSGSLHGGGGAESSSAALSHDPGLKV